MAIVTKLLAILLVALYLSKVLFRKQLRAVAQWLDGAVNAVLIAMLLAFCINLALVLTGGK